MNNVNNPAVGGGSGPTTQTNVIGSRLANGTVYQNTGVTVRYVLVGLLMPSGGTGLFTTDPAAAPSQDVGYWSNGNLVTSYLVNLFLVLPGYYYKCTVGGTASLNSWYEYN